MKVISLLQPWATLVVIGAKKIETRSWKTKFRGQILIHASMKQDPIYRQFFYQWKEAFKLPLHSYKELPFGAIIGSCFIDDMVPTTEMKSFWETPVGIVSNGNEWRLTKKEFHFGDYSDGRYAWLLSRHSQFPQPISAKGSLSLWDYDMPDHFHIPVTNGYATFSSPPSV